MGGGDNCRVSWDGGLIRMFRKKNRFARKALGKGIGSSPGRKILAGFFGKGIGQNLCGRESRQNLLGRESWQSREGNFGENFTGKEFQQSLLEREDGI